MKKEAAKKQTSADNSFGIASVVLGIFSIVFASVNGVILGIIGLIFAVKQQKRAPNSWAKSGKILSIIGIILSIVVLIISAVYLTDVINKLGV
ncbi:MAG: DUF4190 domain-containing protein [Nanoarchaeota archaeon]|nr:DUF4190 domain-containing protein [Nanoarchaeota archaeon]MBU1051656.1 DUF4190 domain-containing protein [Nanoarchaeota archaeon]MBU1988791.1 DUF4190 domain-containing protein [Nanoarchaeota archaeon]